MPLDFEWGGKAQLRRAEAGFREGRQVAGTMLEVGPGVW